MANAPANIVYPIHGGTYPISDPAAPPPLSSAYVTFSFGVTCEGGPHRVEWGVDGQTFGRGEYYDQLSAQFVQKIEGGSHEFWVRTDCGEDGVKFNVG